MSEQMADNPRDAEPSKAAQKPSWWADWGRTFVLAILFALVIRAFLFQPFNITYLLKVHFSNLFSNTNYNI